MQIEMKERRKKRGREGIYIRKTKLMTFNCEIYSALPSLNRGNPSLSFQCGGQVLCTEGRASICS